MEPAQVSRAALAALSLDIGSDSVSQTRRAVTRWGCFYIPKGLGALQVVTTPSILTPPIWAQRHSGRTSDYPG